jgi:hypothetical protein
MVLRVFALAAAVVLTVNQFSAAQTVLGIGSVSCEEWLRVRAFEAPRNNISALIMLYHLKMWIDGYISGTLATESQSDILSSKTSRPTMYSLVDNYCRIHPLDPVASGAVALVRELQERAQR